MRVVAIVFACTLVTVPVGACARGAVREVQGVRIREDDRGLWAKATFPADSAVKLVLARVPGGRITEAELEEEKGRLVYSFDVKAEGRKDSEIRVDARTGEVVEVADDD
jgi:uncharacterized membrane protein YkoI